MSQNASSLLILWTYLAIEYRRAHYNQIHNKLKLFWNFQLLEMQRSNKG